VGQCGKEKEKSFDGGKMGKIFLSHLMGEECPEKKTNKRQLREKKGSTVQEDFFRKHPRNRIGKKTRPTAQPPSTIKSTPTFQKGVQLPARRLSTREVHNFFKQKWEGPKQQDVYFR